MSLFFFLISIIVYLQSPLSEVKTIDIQGNTFVTDEDIIELSGLSTETNIWTMDISKIENELQTNPIIDEVTIDRQLPWTVSLDVSEMQIVGFVEENKKFYPVLDNGELLETKEHLEFNGEAPLLIGFTDKEYLSKMASELNNLPADILDLISELHWQPESDNKNTILLYMNDGFIVQGTIRDFSDGMLVYPSVVSQLDPEVKGIIHIGAGVYFEAFDENEDTDTDEEETEETAE